MEISFYVLAYNHSNLIEHAIKGAFGQEGDPMEIIISDDCSTDDTWDKIQSVVAGYQGHHKVITRRNDKNMGIAEHINIILGVCSGNWIFASAGDDWSHPSRVRKTMQLIADNPNAMLVQTWLNEVDYKNQLLSVNDLGKNTIGCASEKTSIRDRLKGKIFSGHGAAMAYSRQLISVFGYLPHDIIFEDNILSLRAELLGELLILKDPLVNHTNHDGQVTRVVANMPVEQLEKRRISRLVSDINSTKQNYLDIKAVCKIQETAELNSLLRIYSQRLKYFKLKLNAITGRYPGRLFYLIALFRKGNKFAPLAKDDFIRGLLPLHLYRFVRKINFEINS